MHITHNWSSVFVSGHTHVALGFIPSVTVIVVVVAVVIVVGGGGL
jgi:hypothetical protein